MQEAIFLTRFASKIDLLVRSELRASDVLLHELDKHTDKITIHLQTTPIEITGDGSKISAVIAQQGESKRTREFRPDGVFVFIGLKPNTGFLVGSGIELDAVGLVETDAGLVTSIPGIYAAGDVRSGSTMQIASAVGEGATAALYLRRYLEG